MQIRNLKPPVPFKPFNMDDVKAHPKLASPKGLETINKTEQGLNAIGRSLREKGDVLVEIEPVIPKSLVKDQVMKLKIAPSNPGFNAKQFEVKNKVVKALAEARANYRKQKQDAIDAKVKDKADSIVHPKTEAPDAYTGTGAPVPSPALAPLVVPVPAFSQPNPPGDIPALGDPRYAAITLSTQVQKNLSPLSIYFGVKGKIGVTILSQNLDPATFQLGFTAALAGDKALKGSFHAPYAPLPIPVNKYDKGEGIKGDQGLDLTKEVRTTVMLGPVPVTFVAGARGSVALTYGVNAAAAGTISSSNEAALDETWFKEASQKAFDKSSYSIGLDGYVKLEGKLTLFASAVAGGEIDLWLCTIGLTFGVATEINLFDGNIGYDLLASVRKDPNGKAVGDLTLTGGYEIKDALHGELYFTATLDLCIKNVSYKYSIYSFDIGAQTGGPQYFLQEHLSDNLF